MGSSPHHVVWLAEDFLSQHPGYHVNPKRLNGSSVETLSSQLKHATAGHLNVANYEAAKATLITKIQSKGKDEYRSDTLFFRQGDLLKNPMSKKKVAIV